MSKSQLDRKSERNEASHASLGGVGTQEAVKDGSQTQAGAFVAPPRVS